MKTRTVLAGCVVAALLAVAPVMARQQVSVQFDKNYDFTKVSSFAAQIQTSWGNPIGEENVLTEIEQALVAKGWTTAAPESADVSVLIHGTSETKKELNAMYTGGGWRFADMGSATVTETEFTIGTLVVDIFDSASKELLFRGIAKDELSAKPEKNAKKLEKATTRIFQSFPPSPPPPPDEKQKK
jgi:hypothetical protein